MPFILRFRKDTASANWSDVVTLSPNPVEVDYPETREFNSRITQDHAVVIQRPLKDSRSRKWIWKNYRSSTPKYELQWQNLLCMEARARALSDPEPVIPFGKSGTPGDPVYDDNSEKIATIQIFENVTDEGGLGETDDDLPMEVGHGNVIWTTVKLLQVHRKSRSGGGVVVYDESTIEFVISDPSWENF